MQDNSPKNGGHFPVTEWTLVRRLQHQDTHVCKRALNELCTLYHYPLYCFIRQRGLSHHDAEDALHDFLAKLLRLEAFNDLTQEKGRLRTFMAKALQRFLITRHQREHQRSQREVSLENGDFLFDPALEQRYERELASSAAMPDVMFDRQWCEQLLNGVLLRLEVQYRERQKTALFATLRPVLSSGGSLRGHDAAAMAAALAMTEGALRTALVRLLRDYRALLVEEVRQTVASKEEVEAEIADLMKALERSG